MTPIEPGADRGGYRNMFREFKVYDDTRHPPEWTALVGPTQCTVFLKDVKTANPLALDGTEVVHVRDCTFFLFERLDEAHAFCEAQVQRFPQMCCDVFDSDGKAKPPMMVVMHPSTAEKDELSPSSVKWRRNVAIGSLVASAGLFSADWQSEFELTWPSILAVNLFLLGLRFLHWNTASTERRRRQEKRVAEHLRREREQDARSSSEEQR